MRYIEWGFLFLLSGLGIGLANLYNRLQILYEKPTNFKIASKEGAYTRITLVLPAAPDHSKDIFKRKE